MLDPIALAHACADERELEQDVLAALERMVGFDVAFIAGLGDLPTTVGLDAAALARAFGRPGYDAELLPLKRAAAAARGVAVDTEVFGEDGVRRLRYFREFARPVGGRHSLVAWLVLRGRPIGVLMLGRTTARGFRASEVDAVASLLPALTIARASFTLPWTGGPLPDPPASVRTRALSWARGERILARADDGERAVVVRDRAGHREMVALRPGAQLVWSRARLDDPRRSGWFYVELFHLAAARARGRRRALFIGSGGAVGVRQFAEVYPGIAIDLVDVDPRVLGLAADWFDLGSIPRLTTHVADGAAFLERSAGEPWDVIVVDAYDEADVPEALSSRAFFGHVRRALSEGGAVAVNVIGALEGDTSVRSIQKTMVVELDDVRIVPVIDPDEAYSPFAVRNVVVIGLRP